MTASHRPVSTGGEPERRADVRLQLEVLGQPDDVTCGPTCLHAVYRYHGDPITLAEVIDQVPRLDHGGTLAVHLANHALRRGYEARIFTFNLVLFDPTWFAPGVDLDARLAAQAEAKADRKLRRATKAYRQFLRLGGELVQEDLTPDLIRRHIRRGVPLLTGLSSTYLYRAAREYGPEDDPDDVRGVPSGHFVVLHGYDRQARTLQVADPYRPNPYCASGHYPVSLSRVVCSILLGVLTHDANLLVLTRRRRRETGPCAT